MADNTPVRAIILVGGPTRGTRFRPLSLNVPKPLFLLAGRPLIWHHIAACRRELPGLRDILLLGSYHPSEFRTFVDETQQELDVKIEYLKEDEALGTAGGLWEYRQQITNGVDYFFVLHSDICCAFPLSDILKFHKQHGKYGTLMGTRVAKDIAVGFGCYVADEPTNRMLHYAERPESYISDTINAGIYCFSKSVLSATIKRTPSKNDLMSFYPEAEATGNSLSMERDVLPHLAEEKQVYAYFYSGFWRSVKNPGSALYCNEQYLKHYVQIKPEWYAKGPQYVGNVIVDPTAKVDPEAKIGPNVYIGPRTVIGPGVRIHDAIISSDCVLKERCCVLWSILGPQSSVGQWSRIEGLPTATVPTGPNMKQNLNITVFGQGVSVAPEIIVRNCIVMPHKELSAAQFNEILL